MPDNCLDDVALDLACTLCKNHNVTDPKTITLVQLGVTKGIEWAFDPYPVLVESPKLKLLKDALNRARGWVVTCSSSAKARHDLRVIDAVLQSQRD